VVIVVFGKVVVAKPKPTERRNTMTNNRMALAELVEKGSDVDLLREMIGFVAQRLMDVDVESLTGPDLGDARRDGAPQDPEASRRELLPRVPGAEAQRQGKRAAPTSPSGRHKRAEVEP
jgi:hypothetical protein